MQWTWRQFINEPKYISCCLALALPYPNPSLPLPSPPEIHSIVVVLIKVPLQLMLSVKTWVLASGWLIYHVQSYTSMLYLLFEKLELFLKIPAGLLSFPPPSGEMCVCAERHLIWGFIKITHNPFFHSAWNLWFSTLEGGLCSVQIWCHYPQKQLSLILKLILCWK